MREFLYSPGHGSAGWSTWNGGNRDQCEFCLFYEPLITALKKGLTGKELDPILDQFISDYEDKFGERPFIGGAKDLSVGIASGEFMIEEYDGNEDFIERADDDRWF